MSDNARLALFATCLLAGFGAGAPAAALTVGVSWANFRQDRWTSDERAMRAALEAAGVGYESFDASNSAAKQYTDVEKLIAAKVDALVVVTIDTVGLRPLVDLATRRGIPVIAYDRLIDDPSVYYISFDNTEIGRMQARALLAARPVGDYFVLKGDPEDPNTDFLYDGQMQVLAKPIASGRIRNVGEAFVPGWLPIHADAAVEAMLAANDHAVDAVLAANDTIATGVVSSLARHGLAGKVALSGQDGDHDALNRVALGTQTMTIWKDTRTLGRRAAEIAIELAGGKPMGAIAGTEPFRATPSSPTVNATLLTPIAVTVDNLEAVVDSGWIDRQDLCADVPAGAAEVCD